MRTAIVIARTNPEVATPTAIVVRREDRRPLIAAATRLRTIAATERGSGRTASAIALTKIAAVAMYPARTSEVLSRGSGSAFSVQLSGAKAGT